MLGVKNKKMELFADGSIDNSIETYQRLKRSADRLGELGVRTELQQSQFEDHVCDMSTIDSVNQTLARMHTRGYRQAA